MTIKERQFGEMQDGHKIDLYELSKTRGMEAAITNYGATLVSLKIPGLHKKTVDVTLGYDSLQGYMEGGYYFGCTVGRYANRISGGKFTLLGKTYVLEQNEGENHLYGGNCGFDKAVWEAEKLDSNSTPRRSCSNMPAVMVRKAIRQRGSNLWAPKRVLSGNPAFPEFTQPARISIHRAQPRRNVSTVNLLPVLIFCMKICPASARQTPPPAGPMSGMEI